MSQFDPPPLLDWMTGPQLAEMFGITRQQIHKMMLRGEFRTLRALGEKPIYVVSRQEAEIIAATRMRKREEREERRATAREVA